MLCSLGFVRFKYNIPGIPKQNKTIVEVSGTDVTLTLSMAGPNADRLPPVASKSMVVVLAVATNGIEYWEYVMFASIGLATTEND